MWETLLVKGWFIVMSATMDSGHYNILLQNCPTTGPCRYSSYKISASSKNKYTIGTKFWINNYLECQQNLREQEKPMSGDTVLFFRHTTICNMD